MGQATRVHDHPGGVGAGGADRGEVGAGPDRQADALVVDPAHDGGRQRLRGQDGHQVAGRVPRVQSPPQLDLVEKVCRRAEFGCDVGDRHAAEAQPAELVDDGAVRPEVGGDALGGGAAQRWQMIEQGHRFTMRLPPGLGEDLYGFSTPTARILRRLRRP